MNVSSIDLRRDFRKSNGQCGQASYSDDPTSNPASVSLWFSSVKLCLKRGESPCLMINVGGSQSEVVGSNPNSLDTPGIFSYKFLAHSVLFV